MGKIVGLALIASIAASTPAQSQSLLNEILKKALSKPTARLAPRVIQSTSLANISSTQAMEIDKLTSASMQNSQIMADRSEAFPLIRAILKTGACAQNGSAWLGLNR